MFYTRKQHPCNHLPCHTLSALMLPRGKKTTAKGLQTDAVPRSHKRLIRQTAHSSGTPDHVLCSEFKVCAAAWCQLRNNACTRCQRLRLNCRRVAAAPAAAATAPTPSAPSATPGGLGWGWGQLVRSQAEEVVKVIYTGLRGRRAMGVDDTTWHTVWHMHSAASAVEAVIK